MPNGKRMIAKSLKILPNAAQMLLFVNGKAQVDALCH